jgi:S-adenosylmethionine:tRNA ribosyltransferase-isomerase
MKLEEFSYDLPEELIAQQPVAVRDQSRMMVVNKTTQEITIREFRDMPEYFGAGDTVVVNNSRVFPARLAGRKETGALIEILLLSRDKAESGKEIWKALLRPAKRIAPAMRVFFAEGCSARIVARLSEKQWLLEFTTDTPFEDFLSRSGRAPLPPYIKREKGQPRLQEDLERYQTIYASESGSVAAPTAGLHFTDSVLEALTRRGVKIAPVTLHVGYGTFVPVETETVEEHIMEEESFSVTAQSAAMINEARRVIAVGTTSARVLESCAAENGRIEAVSGSTRLYVYPGYRFRRIDGLLTNFHLPKSSLFLLVCAFAGRELMLEAYRQAIEGRLRFYSYGDCMLII